MVYKDKKVLRKYQRDWARRKRKGLPTRTTLIPKKLTEEEIRERKRQINGLHRKKKREIINKYLGTKCLFCKYERRLITHRKDNKKHIRLMHLSLNNLTKELKDEKYVYVCYHCHKGVHFCMKYLGLTWEEITCTKRLGFDSQ